MNFTQAIENIFKRFLPSPFIIAVLLTLLTIFLAFFFTESNSDNHFVSILNHWENGIWNNKLLIFAYQMILILVLGHILVLSRPIDKLISKLVVLTTSTASAVILVSFTTMLVTFLNWGLILFVILLVAIPLFLYFLAKKTTPTQLNLPEYKFNTESKDLIRAGKLGVPLPKSIMASAYGDQTTNMLQPFWALPLLGITKLKAREILPYTLLLILVGSTIYLFGLLIF
jgi:short subunit fatty acids transporter